MTREETIRELKILKEDYWDDDGYGHETKEYNDTMLALDMAIEALEQEPKTGHWIKGKYKDDDIRYNDTSYKCDKCGKIVDFKENYCPNCGLKMVEP